MEANAIGEQVNGRGDGVFKMDALGFGARADTLYGVGDEFGGVLGFDLQIHAAGFDFGEIEDVVDQFKEVRGVLVDVLDEALLLVTQRAGGFFRAGVR